MTSSKAERVIRVISAEERYPTASAGRRNWTRCTLKFSAGDTYVIGGIHPIHATTIRMMTMPSQNDGIERPASENTLSA